MIEVGAKTARTCRYFCFVFFVLDYRWSLIGDFFYGCMGMQDQYQVVRVCIPAAVCGFGECSGACCFCGEGGDIGVLAAVNDGHERGT